MEVVNNKYVSTAITIGLGLYAALLGPELPTFVKDLFKNTLFRILILFLVIVKAKQAANLPCPRFPSFFQEM